LNAARAEAGRVTQRSSPSLQRSTRPPLSDQARCTPIGLALYYFTYSTFLGRPTLYLEDLFVLPAERGNGAGRALLRALAKIAVRLRPDGVGGARLEHTLDPLLPEARREAPARVDPHSSRPRAAPPP